MKKLIAFLTVLFVSVLCTACINNFAVQELNNKAKGYLEAGDIESAICRLQSSVDLDGNIFETRYNLAIAYIKNNSFEKAKEQIEAAMKLKADSADSYYSLGVINEGLAYQISQPEAKEGEEAPALNKKEIELAVSRFNEAEKAYEQYLAKAPDAADKNEVKSQIESIKRKVEELNEQAKTALEAPQE